MRKQRYFLLLLGLLVAIVCFLVSFESKTDYDEKKVVSYQPDIAKELRYP